MSKVAVMFNDQSTTYVHFLGDKSDVHPTAVSNDSPSEDPGSMYFTIQEELDFDQRYITDKVFQMIVIK